VTRQGAATTPQPEMTSKLSNTMTRIGRSP
jgi:hypothetical protein